jgi:hypothetical protein
MASISKLTIQEARAFSPQDDEQVMEFMSPLLSGRMVMESESMMRELIQMTKTLEEHTTVNDSRIPFATSDHSF